MTTHTHPTAPRSSTVNDGLTTNRVPAGHHPSCPARDGSGPCVGCGPRDLTVVARTVRARLLVNAPTVSARVLAAEGLI